MIDDVEARLGSAAFCGLSDAQAAGDGDASSIVFTYGGRTAVIPIRQSLRPDAIEVVQALRKRGFDLMMLSGDRPDAVRPIAERLGLTQWFAAVTPAEKIAFIELLKSQGRRVLMVGDGLNDAPALAAAHASLSPITAAHLTQAQADALFLGDRLAPALRAVIVARQGPFADAAESRARRDLQRDRRTDRGRRPGYAADRSRGDVGVLDPGDAERPARPTRWPLRVHYAVQIG